MPKRKKLRTIIDTNLFISYLIGRKLKGLKALLVDSKIELIFAEQNLIEIQSVSSREKFKKYFDSGDVADLIDFMRIIGGIYEITTIREICRDPKDDFLLSLAEKSSADYLVTGDKDLLVIKKHFATEIITIDVFESLIEKLTKA